MMAQTENVLLCLVAMSILWTFTGLPLARCVAPSAASWMLAPAFGFAIFNVVALPVFELVGMTRAVVLTSVTATAVISIAAYLWRPIPIPRRDILVLAGSAILICAFALGPMTAVLPKAIPEGITLASPVFDHAKIALVDEMIRAGVPPKNAFFFESGITDYVAYYYLWHFAAAVIAIAVGASGWEADAALTFFTAFTFLTTASGLAIWLSGRTSAALIAPALTVPASARQALEWVWPQTTTFLTPGSGLGGWLFQTSWAPQHVASATSVVLACVLLSLLPRQAGWRPIIALGLVATAGFQSSVWVGGAVFVLASTMISAYLIAALDAPRRRSFLARLAAAAAIAVALSTPLLIDQLALSSLRGGGSPIGISPIEVLGSVFEQSTRRVLDIPAYWLIYLPLELPAIYLPGAVAAIALLRRNGDDSPTSVITRALALLLVISLLGAWLLVSTVGGNNDLGWRAILPGVMVLIVFATTVIAQWAASPARRCAALVALGTVVAAPHTIALFRNNMFGSQLPSVRAFAAAPALWAAVRRHTAASERIANNPGFLADMTPWPVNISWALMANRRSCYAGRDLAIPFAPIPAEQRVAIDKLFERAFQGDAVTGDVEQLARRFGCNVVVVTVEDGAWQRDPFLASGIYRLVEAQPDAWRIYRAAP